MTGVSAYRFLAAAAVVLLSAGLAVAAPASVAALRTQPAARSTAFVAHTGAYTVSFRSSAGGISIKPRGGKAALLLREFAGNKKVDLLYAVTRIRHTGSRYVLSGKSSWATFSFTLDLSASTPGLLHFSFSPDPYKDAPAANLGPDVQLTNAQASTLKEYMPAPPIAGTSEYLSIAPLKSSVLYFADLTRLGQFFDRTNSGPSQSNFEYPRAGLRGSLVGKSGDSFGYVAPPGSVGNLPHGKATAAIDSYLYLLPGVPSDEASMADTYLKLLGTVYGALPKPSVPSADWKGLASQSAQDLAQPANFVSLNGLDYLRSYVSDTRSSPELITQADVLAGLQAYEQRYGVSVPLAQTLEHNLGSFYDQTFHTVKNGLGHDSKATEESWYYVQNLIFLLRLAQGGSETARGLLLNSADAAMTLAHTNNYEFPQSFPFAGWNGRDSGVQPDVAGGYAWLMLGMYDLTGEGRYLDEAKASIRHLAGKGMDLSYETQMTAYAAAAAQRLYKLTGEAVYRGYALLALANLFHATRLWDCTYGNCRKGSGYHTYFGLNPLPWSDYIAMLEQSEAWFGLRDYMKYADGEPAYVTDLVRGFLTSSPATMQYALPTHLPPGVAVSNPAEYGDVPHNNLSWDIPLEDLREGEITSGQIGQEIYGAGGTFLFAAYAP